MRVVIISSERDSASQDASQHERLGQLFARLLELPPEQREAFIAQACGADAALRRDLVTLIEAHQTTDCYLDNLSAGIVKPALSALTGVGNDAFSSATVEQLQENLAHQYRIERELGGAGMSRVFLAEEIRLKVTVQA